jgi:hypothetical protein
MGSAATLLSTLVVWMSGLMSLVVCAIASSPGCALGVAGLLLLTLAALALGMEADAKTICQQVR